MSHSRRFLAVALLVAMVAPSAAATWYAYGSHEPSTSFDDPTLMWANPPGDAKNRVYFNVFSTTGGPVGAQIFPNPNVGALRSDLEVVGFEAHVAILGWWVDCNRDGYVGMAETAVREYKSELLLDSSLCPPKSGTNTWKPENGHNVNGWVTELIPIGNRVTRSGGDTRVIRDDEAMIWGDYGTPEFDFARETCTLRPFPRGTLASTGGVLNYADCRVSLIASDDGDLGSTYNLLAPAELDLADNENWNQAGHPLNQGTLGDDDSSNAIVKTGDCSQDPIANTGDLPSALNALDDRDVYPPSTQVNPNGNLPGTVNNTMESGPFPDQKTDATPNGSTSNCDFADDRGADFYGQAETDFDPISTTKKTQANWNFQFTQMTRTAGANNIPVDGGVSAVGGVMTLGNPTYWLSDKFLTKPSIGVTRGSALAGNLDLAAGYWMTFYANVGVMSLSKGPGLVTPGGSGTYGSATCGPETSGIHGGWNCDKNAWYKNADGTPHVENAETSILARPGQRYQLMDVDCFDGTVAKTADGSVDVAVGPAWYGSAPCS